MKRVFYSLAAGCVSAFSTLLLMQFPVLSSITVLAWFKRLFSVLLLPGFLVGYGVSGNVHVASPWLVTLANFVFYSGLVYLVLMVSHKLKARS